MSGVSLLAGQIASLGGGAALLNAAPAVEALGAEGLAALIQGAELALYRQEDWKEEKAGDKTVDLYLEGTAGVDAAAVLAETTVLVYQQLPGLVSHLQSAALSLEARRQLPLDCLVFP